MKLLAITEANTNIKSIATLAGYSKFAKKCGHKFSIYGNNDNKNKVFHFTKNFEKYDFLLFIIHNPNDLPGLPDEDLGYLEWKAYTMRPMDAPDLESLVENINGLLNN